MAAKLRQWVEPPWMAELLRAELDPGERAEAMADFTSTVTDSAGKTQVVTRLFVLTDRHLRSFGFRVNLASLMSSKKPRPVRVELHHSAPPDQLDRRNPGGWCVHC